MISNELDVDRYKAALARNGRVQIPSFLQLPAAERLSECLRNEVPWVTAERGYPDRLCEENVALEAEMLKAAYERASKGFHFVYDRYLMVDAMREGRDPHLVLHAVLTFLNSPPFLGFIRYLTGNRDLAMVGAQATRYRPGQFLQTHDDRHDDEGRRYAYVINLTRRWEADWGGLLHFTDDNGAVEQSFLPLWNSLSLFKVPFKHHVGLISPWAQEPRLGITGWWHVKTS